MPFKAYCNLEQFMQEQLHTRNWFDITCVLLVATKLAGAKKGHFTTWTSLKICQAFFENSITSKDFKQQQACLQISKLWFNFVYLINYVCERQHKTVVVHKKTNNVILTVHDGSYGLSKSWPLFTSNFGRYNREFSGTANTIIIHLTHANI